MGSSPILRAVAVAEPDMRRIVVMQVQIPSATGNALVAQLAVRLICNQQAQGSSPCRSFLKITLWAVRLIGKPCDSES